MPGTSDFNKSVVVFGLLISLLLVLFIGGLRKDHGWQSFNSLRLPHGAPAVQLKIATNIFTSGRNGQSGHDLPAAWAEALRARAEGPNCKLFENGQSIVRMTNITDGPHMFGYFDKSPWSPDGRWFLVSRVPSSTRAPAPGEEMEIGVVDYLQACETGVPQWRKVASTRAYNMQQGTMMQWLGNSSSHFIFNDRGKGCLSNGSTAPPPDDDTLCAVVCDMAQGRRAVVLPMPIYSVSFDGTKALAIDMAKIAEIGPISQFGYKVPHPFNGTQPSSPTEGVWVMDIPPFGSDTNTDASRSTTTATSKGNRSRSARAASSDGWADPRVTPRLVVSHRAAYDAVLAAGFVQDEVTGQSYGNNNVSSNEADAVLKECYHWINTPQFSKEGDYISFIYRFGVCTPARPWQWRSFQLVLNLHTGQLWRMPLTFTSHTDWAWGGTLLSSDLTGYYTANWHKPVQVFHPTITSQTIDAHVARNVSLQQQQSQQQNENGEAFNATAAAAAVRKAISVGLQLPHVLGDGHGTFAPGASQRFVLADTYRIAGLRTLFVQDRFKGTMELLGRFALRNEGKDNNFRVDLHPRWDRHGRVVCFDSTHEGSRQVYVAQPASTPVTARDASVLTARGRHVAARHVAVFGARRAGFVAGLVRQAEDEGLAPYTRLSVVDLEADQEQLPKNSLSAVRYWAAVPYTEDASVLLCPETGRLVPGPHDSHADDGHRGDQQGAAGAAATATTPKAGAGTGADTGAVARQAASQLSGVQQRAQLPAPSRHHHRHQNKHQHSHSNRHLSAVQNQHIDSRHGHLQGPQAKRLLPRLMQQLSAFPSRRLQQHATAAAVTQPGMGSCPSVPRAVQAANVSAWLYEHAFLEQYVECYFDGSYGSREVLLQMVRDGSVLLCDRVDMWRPDMAAAAAGSPGGSGGAGLGHGSADLSGEELQGGGQAAGGVRGGTEDWGWWQAVGDLLDEVKVAVTESYMVGGV